MSKRRSSSKRVLRPEAEIKSNPESEKQMMEREAIAEREKLLDELGRCFVQAAVTRLLNERQMKQGG
jgi:hypothetical protein